MADVVLIDATVLREPEGSSWPPPSDGNVEAAARAQAPAWPPSEGGAATPSPSRPEPRPFDIPESWITGSPGAPTVPTVGDEEIAFIPNSHEPIRTGDLYVTRMGSSPIFPDVPLTVPVRDTIKNQDGAVILGTSQPHGSPISGHEFRLVPSGTGAPILNGDTVLGSPGPEARGIVSNESPSFFPSPSAPGSNDRSPGVILGGPPSLPDEPPPPWTHGPISNEQHTVGLRTGPTMTVDGQATFGGGGPGVVNVDQGAVSFMQGGPVMGSSDVHIGGGGDVTRSPRSDEVSFLGQGIVHHGAVDVFMAPTGDPTRRPGLEDVTTAPTGEGVVANADGQHVRLAESREPPISTSTEVQEGARGKPLKRNVT